MPKIALIVLLSATLLACATQSPTQKTGKSPQKFPKKPTIALVLGGGGAKGFAHIGVIDELEKHGIRPDLVVGTSAGAIVGAVYAAGKSPQQLTQFAKQFDESTLIDVTPAHQGLLAGKKLQDYVNQQVGNLPAERLPIRFAAVATDAQTRQATAFTVGNTGLLVQASSSIPKLFIAPRINAQGQADRYGKRYLDGGQSALVPSAIARKLGADIVIAVDVMADTTPPTPNLSTSETLSVKRNASGISAQFGGFSLEIPLDFKDLPFKIDEHKIPETFDVVIPSTIQAVIHNPTSIWQTLSTAKMSEQDKQASDVIIRPATASISPIDSHKYSTAIRAGKVATQSQILTIQHLIAQKTAHKWPKNKKSPNPLSDFLYQ